MTNPSLPSKRICSKCGRELPATLEFFYKDKRGKNGLAYTCKECTKARALAWRQVNRERDSANARRWKQNHPEQVHAYNKENAERIKGWKRAWREANPEKVREQKKRSHVRHRDHNIARSKRWQDANAERLRSEKRQKYAENADAMRQRQRDYYWAHRERILENNKRRYPFRRDKVKAYQREYQRRKPGIVKANSKASVARRRARQYHAEGTYTRHDVEHLFDQQERRCAYCGILLYWDIPYDIEVDHVVPLVQGGTNWPDNLLIACKSCNQEKADQSYEDWKASRGW